jgi:hypothetical protein
MVLGLFGSLKNAEDAAKGDAKRFPWSMARVLSWDNEASAYCNTVVAYRNEDGTVKEYRR